MNFEFDNYDYMDLLDGDITIEELNELIMMDDNK
jgi:hypothetical protein